MSPRMSLADVAAEIDERLRSAEADEYQNAPDENGIVPFKGAGAVAEGNAVSVTYLTHHQAWLLDQAEARAYHRWLAHGNVGTHFEQQWEDGTSRRR